MRNTDQVATLRAMKERLVPVQHFRNGIRSIAVTSGKGGVGKTSVVANLAIAISDLNLRTLVLDADMGLANIDVILGLTPKYTIQDFLQGSVSLREIIVEGPRGLKILPASSGVMELTELSREQRLSLMTELNALKEENDILLIDTAAGISSNVLYFNAVAEEVIVITSPEPTSITDAYALIKLMAMKYRRKRFYVLVNGVRSEREGSQVFQGLNRVVERFLNFSLKELGYIPWDSAVPKSVRSQKSLMELFPETKVAKSFQEVALRIVNSPAKASLPGEVTLFGPYA